MTLLTMDKAYRSLLKRAGKAAVAITVVAAGLGALTWAVIHLLGLTFYTIAGPSMEPTFKSGQLVVLKQEERPQDGHLVFFYKPDGWRTAQEIEEGREVLVKRLVAAPGDSLSFDGKAFSVNGKPVFTLGTYTCTPKQASYSHKLTDQELFVMGDNAPQSLDSRHRFCSGDDDFFVDPDRVISYGSVLFKS